MIQDRIELAASAEVEDRLLTFRSLVARVYTEKFPEYNGACLYQDALKVCVDSTSATLQEVKKKFTPRVIDRMEKQLLKAATEVPR